MVSFTFRGLGHEHRTVDENGRVNHTSYSAEIWVDTSTVLEIKRDFTHPLASRWKHHGCLKSNHGVMG